MSLPETASRRWRAALLKTPWGRRHITQVPASHADAGVLATVSTLRGMLDGRPSQVRAVSDIAPPGSASVDATAMRALVAQWLDEARRDDVELLLLCSPPDVDSCVAHGFVDITPDTLTLTVDPGKKPGAPMVMLRAGEERDLPALAAMSQVQAAPFRFSLVRDAEFIQHGLVSQRLRAGLAARGEREVHFFVVEEGSMAVAYVVLRVEAGEWWIESCGDRDPSGYRLGCILQALLARDPASTPSRIRGWLPGTLVPPQVTVVDRARTPGRVMAATVGAHASAAPLSSSEVLLWESDVC